METLAEYCRTYTKLTAMQCELLKRMSICFPFAADLTHAHVSVYAMASEPGHFVVLSHDKPHTIFSPAELAEARAEKLAPHEVRKLRDGSGARAMGSA